MIIQLIDAAILAQEAQRPFRNHLGPSSIGQSCARKIWYEFRWVGKPKHSASKLRLFNRGHLEETRFLKWLEDAGVTVWATTGPDAQRIRFVGYKGGHFSGEIDGVGQGVLHEEPFLLEFKTHSDKSFKDLVANKVKISKPDHYVQMQMYMGMSGLKRALYLAINKNDDSLYEEMVEFDEACFVKYSARAASIIDAAEPPPRINNSPAWYECKMCDFSDVCHGKQPPLVNCRTCAHSTPADNGEWLCEHEKAEGIIPNETLAVGCMRYYRHPME